MPNLLPPSSRESERACSFELHICGGCPHLHVALIDKNGDIYADMVMSRNQLVAFYKSGMEKIDKAIARNLRSQGEAS